MAKDPLNNNVKQLNHWSRFLTEGARMDNYSGGFQNIFAKETQNSIRKQRKKPKDRTWAFSKEALIGTRPRRQFDLRTLKIDPKMVDLGEKAKQTATVTSECTSKFLVKAVNKEALKDRSTTPDDCVEDDPLLERNYKMFRFLAIKKMNRIND
ncbi:hypothetical protein Bca101_031770 [Brassica carinata]